MDEKTRQEMLNEALIDRRNFFKNKNALNEAIQELKTDYVEFGQGMQRKSRRKEVLEQKKIEADEEFKKERASLIEDLEKNLEKIQLEIQDISKEYKESDNTIIAHKLILKLNGLKNQSEKIKKNLIYFTVIF